LRQLFVSRVARRIANQISTFGRALGVMGVAGLALVVGLGSIGMGLADASGARTQADLVRPDGALLALTLAPVKARVVPVRTDPEAKQGTAPQRVPPVATLPKGVATQLDDAEVKPTVAGPKPSSASVSVQAVTTPRAVVIVGPSGEADTNLVRAEEFAARAELHGMDVRRVFHPNATWANVLANIQGASLVAYFGHGNSWPSPYGPFQERTKDGFGLNKHDGGSAHEVAYYGADFIRRKVTLAPNAVVLLSHLCYSAGNGEPRMAIPTWDVAWQRVDNYASGFLSAGAGAVFAYATGSITPIVDELFESDKTMDQIFMTAGAKPEPYYGFTGWDDRYYDSARTPGGRNHLDPGRSEGFKRALTGDLSMTAADWRTASGAG
jgi:hypothetical protein